MNSLGFFSIIGFLILACLLVFSGFELDQGTEFSQAVLAGKKFEIQKLKATEVQSNLKTAWKESVQKLIFEKEIETIKIKQSLVQTTLNFLENYNQINPDLEFFIEHENKIQPVSVSALNSIIFVTVIRTGPVFWVNVQTTQAFRQLKLCWKNTMGTSIFSQCLPKNFELELIV